MATPSDSSSLDRRQFLKKGGSLAAGATLLSSLPSHGAFVSDDQTIRLALIGCGGRGTGAVKDAFGVPNGGPIKLWAMADLDRKPIDSKLKLLKTRYADKIEVPEERKFVGFEAYKAAIDTLRPGDVAMCTTRAYIRSVHVEYAVRKGINVFMEKPFASDPVGIQRIQRAAKLADENGVKIAAGLQCRHSPARQALIDRIRHGEMGEIPLIRANRLGGGTALAPQGDKALKLTSQISFGRGHLLWIGSGIMVDNLIHQIDECCWIADAWPVTCVGMGGRDALVDDCGQNHHMYSIEFTYPNGTKAMCGFRRQSRARGEFATWIHGSKCAAQFSGQTHAATVHMFKDQRIEEGNIAWTPKADAHRPWQYEWNALIESIRTDRKHNEGHRAAFADIASIMARAACHTGREVTWEDVAKSDFEWCNYLEKLDYDSPVPVKPDAKGQFPIPGPRRWNEI